MKKYYRYDYCHLLFIGLGIIISLFLFIFLIIGLIEEDYDNVMVCVVSLIFTLLMILPSYFYLKSFYLTIENNTIKLFHKNKLKDEFKINDIKEIYISRGVGRYATTNMTFVFEKTDNFELSNRKYFKYLKDNNIKNYSLYFNKKLLQELKPRKYNIQLNMKYKDI